MRLQSAIFDMDGTLLDSMPTWRELGPTFLKEAGISATPEQDRMLHTLADCDVIPYLREVCGLPWSQQEIIDQTNMLRQEYGLASLAVDENLMEAAQVRADEMAATGTYSHTRPGGLKYYTVTDCPYVTENIHRLNQEWLDAMDLELADAAVQDWTESSGHLEHMVSGKVDAIGVGIAEGTDDQGRECWYCVQLFRYTGQKITWVDEPAHP